ncbi:hypothetical protein HPB50_003546 [Hyalomma asiaticum]|uniref:Uncharacterized protein n=1 Tax=Hyalomma asiaticum TaxID=266040 RepID=A0ACB7SRS5_HYAAI|nr:hypothetical protein HPB50_003546 [Hyalomma asiaticum]
MTDVPPRLPPRPGGGEQASRGIAASDRLNTALPKSTSCSDVEDMESDGGYVEATNRHLKKKLRRTLSPSELSYSTPPSEQAYPIVYVLVAATGNLNSLNRQTFTAYLGRLAPGKIRHFRINPRRNILAVDVSTRPTLNTLKAVT